MCSKYIEETAVARGIRRISAITGDAALSSVATAAAIERRLLEYEKPSSVRLTWESDVTMMRYISNLLYT